MFIYHYCATYRDSTKDISIDGIIQTPNKITAMEDYRELKKLIDPNNHHKMTISNLSLIS